MIATIQLVIREIDVRCCGVDYFNNNNYPHSNDHDNHGNDEHHDHNSNVHHDHSNNHHYDLNNNDHHYYKYNECHDHSNNHHNDHSNNYRDHSNNDHDYNINYHFISNSSILIFLLMFAINSVLFHSYKDCFFITKIQLLILFFVTFIRVE